MRIWFLLALLLLNTFSSADPAIIQPGSIEGIAFPGHHTMLLADAQTTPGGAAILELTVPANTFGAPPHVHEQEDEFFYVLDGEVEFLDREQTIRVSKGGLVILPRGHLHGFWNLGNQPARLLLVVTPGEFASFFDEVVAEIRRTHPDSPDEVGALIGKAAAQHQVRVYAEKTPASALPVLPK